MPARSAAKSSASTAAMGFSGPPSKPPDEAAQTEGPASPEALARLNGAISELKALVVAPMLRRAVDALNSHDPRTGADWALKALRQDPRSGLGWYVLAVARDRAGDFANALKAYQAAVELLPADFDISNDVGHLAFRMGMKELAEQLFRRYLAAHPDDAAVMSNLASAVRDQGRANEAIEILRAAIKIRPADATLWNTLGTVVSEGGDLRTSLVFFDEALRLDPGFAQARYNRGNACAELGDLDQALQDCETAIGLTRVEDDRLMMQLARATLKLAQSRLAEGWEDYEARLATLFSDSTAFLVDAPRWTPEAPLAGKRLLVIGEQGLGDEVLFANLLPDALAALGPQGRLTAAVETRLTPLFQRSFPEAEIVAHATFRQNGRNYRAAPALAGRQDFDLWTPLASLPRRFRRELADFPERERFLVPDPDRVAHWRAQLQAAPAGLKAGLLWKSMKIASARTRYYSPFELWAPVLKTPGVTFVNVQYGDCAAEIAWAERELGVQIWTPPGIDLKDDLDDIAALTCALDLTIGFMNATTNIAAACGAPTWIISAPAAWTRLGVDRMPWYPQARTFTPDALDRWEETMDAVAGALAAWVAA